MDDVNELEYLHAPLRRMTAQSQFQHEKIARLQRELQEATKEVRSADLIYRKHVLYYARKDCLQLATMMHQKLPMELRELVYEFLCVEPDRPIPVGPYYHFRKYNRPFHDPQHSITRSVDTRIGFAWPPQRTTQPNPYTFHVGISADIDVETGGTSAQQTGSSWPVDNNDTGIISGLAERVMEVVISTPADRLEIDDEDGDTILPDGRVKEMHTHKPPSDMALPYSHFLDPRYVGPEIACEMQKIYYARNTFSICSVERGILHFLGRNSSCNMVGCNEDGNPKEVPKDLQLPQPVYPRDYIRDLQIRVKFEQFHSDMSKDMTAHEKYAYEQRFLRSIKDNLEAFHGFLERRHKLGIHIEFVILTEFPDFEDGAAGWAAQCNYVNFLQCIRNLVYTMVHDCDDMSIKITHYDENISAFPRNITGVFGLSKEQWEHEKSVNEDRRDWAGGFYLAVPDMAEHDMPRGYLPTELNAMLRQRWGMESVLATRATHPVDDGRYWPVSDQRNLFLDT